MQNHWKKVPKITQKASKDLAFYPAIVQQLLYNRGITTRKKAEEFLNPEEILFNDPDLLFDMKKAVSQILKWVKGKKKIFIHGDYDVDGICSTAILWDFLYRQIKADVMPFIPSRFDEGYGMTEASLKQIKEKGGEVVITVDCGIRDDELIKSWTEKGLSL